MSAINCRAIEPATRQALKVCRGSWRERAAGSNGFGRRLAIALLENRIVETVGKYTLPRLGSIPQLPHVLAPAAILRSNNGWTIRLTRAHQILTRNRSFNSLIAQELEILAACGLVVQPGSHGQRRWRTGRDHSGIVGFVVVDQDAAAGRRLGIAGANRPQLIAVRVGGDRDGVRQRRSCLCHAGSRCPVEPRRPVIADRWQARRWRCCKHRSRTPARH